MKYIVGQEAISWSFWL